MKAVFKRELHSLLGGLRGWGYAAIVLIGAAVSALMNNFIAGSTRFEVGIFYIALSMIPATALASADVFQAERRQNTERLLYSLPLKTADIVLGKMAALMVPVLIAFAGLCIFPVFLSLFGQVPLGMAYASILALLLLGIAMMGLGLMVSACANNRYVAFILTVALLALSWLAPVLADFVGSAAKVTITMMIAFMLAAFALVYMLSNNAYLGIVGAGLVEIPMLLSYLQGTGDQLMDTVAGGVRALSLFEGLNLFINGLMDGSAMIMWIASAALFTVITILYIGSRRQAKRRAL